MYCKYICYTYDQLKRWNMNLIGKTRLDLSCAMKSFGRDYKNGVQTKYIYLQKYQLCMRSNYLYKGFGERPAKYKGHVDTLFSA